MRRVGCGQWQFFVHQKKSEFFISRLIWLSCYKHKIINVHLRKVWHIVIWSFICHTSAQHFQSFFLWILFIILPRVYFLPSTIHSQKSESDSPLWRFLFVIFLFCLRDIQIINNSINMYYSFMQRNFLFHI